MSNNSAIIKQADAKRLFSAAIASGFKEVSLIVHPDGRIEARATSSERTAKVDSGNPWDAVFDG